jgi:hypothetical protein
MQVTTAQAQVAISAASLAFSAVLVLVTYLYYRETRAHTAEMRESREAEFQPVLKATVEPWLAVHNRFVFENTGKGAAHDVSAKWGFTHLDNDREWKVPLISPGQRHTFYLPFTDCDDTITTEPQLERELADTDGVLFFEWECTDALGNTVSNREEIDVLETVQSRSGELLVESEEAKIRDELEDLNDSVGDIPKLLKRTLKNN